MNNAEAEHIWRMGEWICIIQVKKSYCRFAFEAGCCTAGVLGSLGEPGRGGQYLDLSSGSSSSARGSDLRNECSSLHCVLWPEKNDLLLWQHFLKC